MSKQCLYCSYQNNDTARFCSHCGQNLASGGLTGRLPHLTILNDRYRIQSKLGAGGQGTVYLADDMRFSSLKWAVKELSPVSIADPVERQAAMMAFRREAEMLAALQHRNLPRVIDRFTLQDNEFFVMEFVPGYSLQSMFDARGDSFPEEQVKGYALQLCDVLNYLHSQNPPVIFRDLKPGNIMVTPDGTIKLIDFGIARHFQAGKAGDTTALGTPGYAPIEAFGKGQTDARSDIYSLGVTLYVLLTGHDPAVKLFDLPPLRTLNARVSPGMESVLKKATMRETVDRYQTIKDLQTALVTLDQGAVKGLPPAPPKPSPTRPDAPQNVHAFAVNSAIKVRWQPPARNGSSNIQGYRITASPGGYIYQASATATEVLYRNLPGGRDYSFAVTSLNGVGESFPSQPSPTVHLDATKPATFKRAGFWAYLFAMGLAIAFRLMTNSLMVWLYYNVGIPFEIVASLVGVVPPLLGYLLTHRRGAMGIFVLVPIFLSWLIDGSLGPNIYGVWIALLWFVADVFFGPHNWQSRNLLLIMFVGALVTGVSQIILGAAGMGSSSQFLGVVIGGAAGGFVAWVLSSVINSMTGVGVTS